MPRQGIGSLSPSEARRVNDLCERFEAAWRSGAEPRIEVSLRELPETAHSALFNELLALELELRCGRGDRPTPTEYLERFPERIRSIDAAFELPITAAGRGFIERNGESATHPAAGSQLIDDRTMARDART